MSSPNVHNLLAFGDLTIMSLPFNTFNINLAGNNIVKNTTLAKMVAKIGQSDVSIKSGEYEPGEIVDGKPISFDIESQFPMWKPKFTLEEGLTKTYKWFEQNLSRYS